MRVLLINGPNLNLLGTREPEVYGSDTLADLERKVVAWGAEEGVEVSIFQTNSEGEIIDRIQQFDGDGIIINPGALSHTSRAIPDAIRSIGVPAVEVHISNIRNREPWRAHSTVSEACVRTIYGRGIGGYRHAIRHLVNRTAMPFHPIRYGPHHENIGDLRPGGGRIVVLVHGGLWRQEYERDSMETLAVDLAKRGGLTSATKGPYFELVKTIRQSHEQGRVLRSVAAMPNLPEDVLADAVRASQAISGDYERRQFLTQSIARQPVTGKSANEVIQAASGIKSDNEQATLLVDLAKRGGVTDETAAAFFPLVSAMTQSFEQRRVLMAVLASPQPLSEGVVTGLLKTAASIDSSYERAELLVAVVRKQTLSPAARSLYLAAADTIRSEHEQTRVFAALVRSERAARK